MNYLKKDIHLVFSDLDILRIRLGYNKKSYNTVTPFVINNRLFIIVLKIVLLLTINNNSVYFRVKNKSVSLHKIKLHST